MKKFNLYASDKEGLSTLGRNGYIQGLPSSMCPFDKGDGRRQWWMSGWLDERTKDRIEKARKERESKDIKKHYKDQSLLETR